MSYTKEQRAANAAKAAATAAAVASGQPVETEVEPAAVETPARPSSRNEPRRQAMEEIEAREAKVRGEQEAAPKPTEAAPEPDAVVEPATPATVDATPAVESAKTVKVKVDGEEFDVPQSEIDEAGGVSSYQKGRAADNRLRKSNESLAQIRQTQEQIAQYIQQQAPKQPTLTDAQFIQSKVDVIRFGTPEESTAALQEVLARQRVDEATIIQRATMHIQKSAAVDNFAKEFQDVASNPLLLKLAMALESERAPQSGPNTNWPEFYRKIGNEVRSVSGRPSQPSSSAAPAAVAPTSDTTSPASDKEARKASIVNLPTAAARAALPTESKPETREDILNQMRTSRGIPTG